MHSPSSLPFYSQFKILMNLKVKANDNSAPYAHRLRFTVLIFSNVLTF